MRRFLAVGIFALLMMAAFATDAHARGGPRNKTFGLGLQLGIPAGITGQAFFTPLVALQFNVGTTFWANDISGNVDVVFHFVYFHHRREDVLHLSLYTGPGAFVGGVVNATYVHYYGPYYHARYRTGPAYFGIRAPFGFAIHWQRVTFDTYVEVAPVAFALVPDIVFTPQFSIGARYYF